jgi:hypothetical protein
VTSAKNTPFLERLIEKDLEVCACLPYKLGLIELCYVIVSIWYLCMFFLIC